MAADAQRAASPRRHRARRGEGERLRAEILDAATRLLFETGDGSAVSIRAIAKAVGVTTPSIYLHFADKDELLWAVCEEQFRKLDETCEEAAAGSSDPLDSLRLRGHAYVRFGLDNAEAYRILFMGRGDEMPEEAALHAVQESAAFSHLVEAVQRCMDAGAIRREDPFVVAFGLWALVHGVTSLLISLPSFPWPQRPEELVDQLLVHHVGGLRDPGPPGRSRPA
ncbi:MAG TPA: TetR/AcrR family transcriptional regulator [Actinomycetes bacterium]|jgi:AcrR family transcriptional regulator|nr:TetR/AcrR family transcriptional regulator [Actinomycetes bacterium]